MSCAEPAKVYWFLMGSFTSGEFGLCWAPLPSAVPAQDKAKILFLWNSSMFMLQWRAWSFFFSVQQVSTQATTLQRQCVEKKKNHEMSLWHFNNIQTNKKRKTVWCTGISVVDHNWLGPVVRLSCKKKCRFLDFCGFFFLLSLGLYICSLMSSLSKLCCGFWVQSPRCLRWWPCISPNGASRDKHSSAWWQYPKPPHSLRSSS